MGFLSNGRLIVGYDLGDDFAQISYSLGKDEEAETLSGQTGAQTYNIPALLCKRTGVNQWYYGQEALKYAQENQGVPVRNLLSLACDGEKVVIEGQEFDPVALLALFMKRSLSVLAQVAPPDKIYALMITCEQIDEKVIRVLEDAIAGLRLKAEHISFQSHVESFYNYMLRQPEGLWNYRSILCDYRGDCIRAYTMELNRKTTPVVAFIGKEEIPFENFENLPEAEALRSEKLKCMDQEFKELAERLCRGSIVSSVYLIGESFREEWLHESLRFLCAGRRVFQGSNLFSKGACYAMQEKLAPGEIGQKYVFLGDEKLKSNVGMHVQKQGRETYLALLDAGVNWYEARQEVSLYLQDGKELELLITSLVGGGSRTVQIVLEDFPEGLSRINARFSMAAEKRLVVEIQNLGLGAFRAGNDHVQRTEIEL